MILFRTDASLLIGSGHVMRCLTLAEEFKKNGFECAFVCKEHEGNLINSINKTFHCFKLKATLFNDKIGDLSHSSWLAGDQIEDAEETLAIVSSINKPVELLIVDHYALDFRWENALLRQVEKLLVLDDLADRKHCCNYLLDQNYYKKKNRYHGLLESNTVQFCGPSFALLRKEFLICESTAEKSKNRFKRVLIFFGGVDFHNMSLFALNALLNHPERDFQIDLVVGSANPHMNEIRSAISMYSSVTLHVQINYMADLMSKVDFCIGAGGATNWERLKLGIPSIVISLAENQIETSQDLHDDGYILYLGHYDQVNSDKLLMSIDKLEEHCIDNNFRRRAMELVDGKGAQRLLKSIGVA